MLTEGDWAMFPVLGYFVEAKFTPGTGVPAHTLGFLGEHTKLTAAADCATRLRTIVVVNRAVPIISITATSVIFSILHLVP
jgi:hypothetical protein